MERDNQQVCEDIIALIHRAKAASIAIAEEQDLTHVQVFVLYSIHSRGELAMRHITRLLNSEDSNVTGLVDRMVVQKLLTRHESPQDRRTKTLRLTKKGQQVIESIIAELPARLGCDRLTVDERQTLHTIIQKITS